MTLKITFGFIFNKQSNKLFSKKIIITIIEYYIHNSKNDIKYIIFSFLISFLLLPIP